MLERVAGSLSACSPQWIVAPPGRYDLSALGLGSWQRVADTRPGEGPLAGLEAGLRALPPDCWSAYCAVDLPHLTPAFWSVLAAFIQPGAEAVIGRSQDGRAQPLAALYRASVLGTITALLDAGERRMLALPERLSIIGVNWTELEHAAPQAYQNVNRVADLK